MGGGGGGGGDGGQHIQLKLLSGVSNLEHFLTSNGHSSAYFSLSSLLLSIAQQCYQSATSFEKGDLQVEKIEPLVPPYGEPP